MDESEFRLIDTVSRNIDKLCEMNDVDKFKELCHLCHVLMNLWMKNE